MSACTVVHTSHPFYTSFISLRNFLLGSSRTDRRRRQFAEFGTQFNTNWSTNRSRLTHVRVVQHLKCFLKNLLDGNAGPPPFTVDQDAAHHQKQRIEHRMTFKKKSQVRSVCRLYLPQKTRQFRSMRVCAHAWHAEKVK